jgi:transketolase N-terminal domain/subunit
MYGQHSPAATSSGGLEQLAAVARQVRRNVLDMVEGLGHGYVGQGLGTADLFAALYFGFLRVDPHNLDRPRLRGQLRISHPAAANVHARYLPIQLRLFFRGVRPTKTRRRLCTPI